MLSVKDLRNLEQILKTFLPDKKIHNPNSLASSEKRRKKINPAQGTGKVSSTEGGKLGKKSLLIFDDCGPFPTKEESLEAAPLNKWFVENYSVGGHPSCRTCTSSIKLHQLCIRWELPTNFNYNF